MDGKRDIPGNARGSALAAQQVVLGIGEKLVLAEKVIDSAWDAGIYVRSLSVRLPDDESSEYRLVIRALVEGEACVAFHNGATLSDVIVGLLNRLQNRSLKFRRDEYA